MACSTWLASTMVGSRSRPSAVDRRRHLRRPARGGDRPGQPAAPRWRPRARGRPGAAAAARLSRSVAARPNAGRSSRPGRRRATSRGARRSRAPAAGRRVRSVVPGARASSAGRHAASASSQAAIRVSTVSMSVPSRSNRTAAGRGSAGERGDASGYGTGRQKPIDAVGDGPGVRAVGADVPSGGRPHRPTRPGATIAAPSGDQRRWLSAYWSKNGRTCWMKVSETLDRPLRVPIAPEPTVTNDQPERRAGRRGGGGPTGPRAGRSCCWPGRSIRRCPRPGRSPGDTSWSAAIVAPSGDQKNATTGVVDSVRTAPESASMSRSGPTGRSERGTGRARGDEREVRHRPARTRGRPSRTRRRCGGSCDRVDSTITCSGVAEAGLL